MTRTVVVTAVVIAALAWIDPLFLPLVALGPIATGLAFRRPRPAAQTWFLAGLLMLVSDLVLNHEDVVFHAALAVVTAAIAAGVAALASRRTAAVV
jgi:hypothetical protein